MGSIFNSAPGMKKRFSSPLPDLDEVDRTSNYPYTKLMQQAVPPVHHLAQQINQIVALRASGFDVTGQELTPSTVSPVLETLHLIAQVLGVAFDVDCCLVTVMAEGTEPVSNSWFKEDPEQLGTYSSQMEQVNLPVIDCAETLTISDISTIEKSLIAGFQNLHLNIKTVLAIPTKFGGQNNGVITLVKLQPYEWTESSKQTLKELAPSCAIAFSLLLQQLVIASQHQYVQTCAQHQSLIKQLSILGRSNLELNQTLQLAITSTAEALQVDRALLILLKYTDPLFRIRLKKQIPNAKATVNSKWLNEPAELNHTQAGNEDFMTSDCGLCQRIFTDSGKPIIIKDIAEHAEIKTAAPLFEVYKLPAILMMPLESQGRILGFVVLQQAVPRSWVAAEINIVEMVCAQLSNSIIQSQTLRQVQTLVDERTAQLQRSLEVQAKLYEKTRQYVQQLRELNELKDEFLSNMSDRLRYPLTNMRMAMRNLRRPEIKPERQAMYLDILEQECDKEINLINDLLTLQKLDTHSERPQLENIDLNSRIQDLVSPFEKKLAEKGINIIIELPKKPLTLLTGIESFDRIILELLTNTVKYSQPDTTVTLKVTQDVKEGIDRVIIEITNIGRGISEEEATYIFDKFRRGKGRWTPGTGLGLALVKSLVQHLNGDIAVTSNQIEGSDMSEIRFTLNLPQFSDEINS
ncbi:GAF sensor signal transduction histidine kinase [Calothrix sp. NIES-4071]|nr:GAF sensor signal transduction histidine kinase [Calothrix sp. NIES-4071]BAZ60966.1 GAF sensor signal transduction histidine kinase [Calothrix sp. NIES-4105]